MTLSQYTTVQHMNRAMIYSDPCKNIKKIVSKAKSDIYYSQTNKTTLIHFNKDGHEAAVMGVHKKNICNT